MKTIHVLGWYQHENQGDESYRLAFPKLFPDYKFVFGEKIYDEPEIIILGGGDVATPKFFTILEKYPKAKKYLFSVNLREKNITPELKQFEKIIVRNFVDFSDIKIQCLPDFTFVLKANKENGKQLIKKLFKKYKCELYENVIMLTMNGFLCLREKMLARDYVNFDKVCYDLAKIMDNTKASFILLPFGNGFPQSDKIANSFVYTNAKFWSKNLLVYDNLSVQQTLDIAAATDAAITTRLHAAIFSCIGETPFIDITHHTKNQMFMEFIGKPDWSLNFWDFNYTKALDLLNDFLNNKDFYRNQVARINTSAKKMLKQLDTKLG